MRNRKKRAQREEVRKILHTMRLELAAQRVTEQVGTSERTGVLSLKDLLVRSAAKRHSARF